MRALAALLLLVGTAWADTAPPPSVAPGTPRPELSAEELRRRLEEGQAVPLYRITFAAGKAQLKPDAELMLAEIVKAARLLKSPERKLLIAAHTDAQGDAEWNRRLSRDRADAIRAWLLAHGIDPKPELVTEGAGEDRPLTDDVSAAGRAKNRRIELSLK